MTLTQAINLDRKWVVWGRSGCSYCDKVMDALEAQDEEFYYFDVRKEPILKEFMQVSGMPMTVPQVFLNGHLIGGSEDTLTLLRGLK